MFNNGLIATFIPEILMVFGYILCLIAPHFKTDTQTETLSPVAVHIISTLHDQPSTYQVHISDFQTAESVLSENDTRPVFQWVIKENASCNFLPELSAGLTFNQFSRPPPFFIC